MALSRDATVVVAGDWAPIRAFDALVRHDPEAAYGDLLPVLRSADLRIVNCECALTRSERWVWKSGAVFKGEPAHVAGLSAVPFHVACLGNNHVLDYGVAGLRDTLRVLHRAGIRTVGAGLTEREACAPVTRTIGGIRVHIVNFSEGEDLTAARGGAPGVFGWDIARVQATVRALKRKGGLVIAIGHCGLEYVPYPPPYVVDAFRAVADAGADCVIGHHPHVLQGIERHHGRPIVYSLGNFLFYQQTNLLSRKTGVCVTLRLRGASIASFELQPYRITDTGLRRLDPPEARDLDLTMARLSKPFRTPRGPSRAWEAYLEYYGVQGFTAEVKAILHRMQTEPAKGAAMFRNRITTMQHAELWRDTLNRVIAGHRRPSSRDAAAMVKRWFTASVDGTAGIPNR